MSETTPDGQTPGIAPHAIRGRNYFKSIYFLATPTGIEPDAAIAQDHEELPAIRPHGARIQSSGFETSRDDSQPVETTAGTEPQRGGLGARHPRRHGDRPGRRGSDPCCAPRSQAGHRQRGGLRRGTCEAPVALPRRWLTAPPMGPLMPGGGAAYWGPRGGRFLRSPRLADPPGSQHGRDALPSIRDRARHSCRRKFPRSRADGPCRSCRDVARGAHLSRRASAEGTLR